MELELWFLDPVIGGTLVILIQEFSRAFIPITGGHHLVLGLMLVIIMLSAREGLYPTIKNKIIEKRINKRRPKEMSI